MKLRRPQNSPELTAAGTSGSITGNVTNSGTLAFSRSDGSTYAGQISGTGGNPFLTPFTSWNYDASLEYYFSRTGFASVAAFHRDIFPPGRAKSSVDAEQAQRFDNLPD